ncbi:glucosaminidase domain-containing protein, partial [Staphylococcus sp. GDB20D115P1]
TKEATTEATKETTPRTANTNTQNTATQTATKNVKQLGQFTTEKPEIKTSVNGNTALNSTKYANKTFTVGKQRTQGDNTYVLIQNNKDNTPIGWVNSKDINTRNLSQSAAKSGNYTVKPTNNGLYAVPWGSKAQKLDDLNNLQQNDFKASKSLHVDKDEYVYGIVNNKTGWIAANDLNAKHHPTATNEASNKDDNTNASDDAVESRYDYVIYNKDGYYYNDPYGKASGSLSDYNEGIFTSYKKLVIDGVTWYYGKLANGEMVWIKETDLRKELIKYYSTGQTLDEAALAQYNLKFKPQVQHTPGEWEDANLGEIKYAMDSSRIANDETQKYQFLRLDKSQNIDANRINELLDGKGILEGQGEAFSEAAKTYNINEVYLVSHALLETGNGTSELANGGDVVDDEVTTDGPNKYYNMFGIGAVDHDAVKQGFTRAKEEGWDTVKKAIVGGAKFIANSYINQGQNTLYKMRWNPENPGDHQYATDISWAEKNATRIKNFYDTMGEVGKYFDVNTYTK